MEIIIKAIEFVLHTSCQEALMEKKVSGKTTILELLWTYFHIIICVEPNDLATSAQFRRENSNGIHFLKNHKFKLLSSKKENYYYYIFLYELIYIHDQIIPRYLPNDCLQYFTCLFTSKFVIAAAIT